MTSSKRPRLGVAELLSDYFWPLCFWLLWTAIIAWVLARERSLAFEQWQTRNYTETRGTITQSELHSHKDSDGTSYTLDVTYSYSVNDRMFTGHRIKFDGSGAHFVNFHKRFQKDAEAPVYFDPSAPERTVLIRGKVELFFLVFFMSSIGATATAWATSWNRVRARCFDAPAAGLPVTRRPGALRVHLTRDRILIVGAFWSGLCVLIMFAGLAAYGPRDTQHVPWLLLIQLASAPLMYLLVRTSEDQLVLDAHNQTFELFESGRVTFRAPYDAVRALWVRERSYRSLESSPLFVLRVDLEQKSGLDSVPLVFLSDRSTAFELPRLAQRAVGSSNGRF